MSRKHRNGLTMPEILVTITVSAILAVAAVPAVGAYVGKDAPTSSQPDVRQLQRAVAGFTTDVHHYPGDLQQLITPIVSTGGNGDSLDFDGAATPMRFSLAEAARWKGPYTLAPIGTGATAGGQFTSGTLKFTIGRRISLSGGWLTVPILHPATCGDLLTLSHALDDIAVAEHNAAAEGLVMWEGTCSEAVPTGAVSSATLRLARAN